MPSGVKFNGREKVMLAVFGCLGFVVLAAGTAWLFAALTGFALSRAVMITIGVYGLACTLVVRRTTSYKRFRRKITAMRARAKSRSSPLLAVEEEQDEPPDDYLHLEHPLGVITRISRMVVVDLLIAGLILLVFGSTLYLWVLWMLAQPFVYFFACRSIKARELRPRELHKGDAILLRHQAGSRKWLLWNSAPDGKPLLGAIFDSPRQTVIEQWFGLNSHTLLVKVAVPGKDEYLTVKVRYVQDIDRLIKIVRWRTKEPVRLAQLKLESTLRSEEYLRQIVEAQGSSEMTTLMRELRDHLVN